ncbi:MAG: aldehyde dehydrogenase family protein [Acidobacteria bacterium]|nr:aldehyde dehydrogenase family protein [Acidobacteriota bacterium]
MEPLAKPQARAETYRNLINGRWVTSSSTRSVRNLNPADTTEVLGVVPLSTGQDVEAAVRAAQEALEGWRETPAPQRGQIVARAAQLLTARKEEVARALTREEGKTVSESLGEVLKSINVLDYMAGEGRRLAGETLPSELTNNFCYTIRQPLGVVAVITPWNFPVCIPCWKIAPALVGGNTVIFKPSTLTPWTATLLVEIFTEAGVPPGVLSLVIGSGGTVGEALVNHPLVRAVSFTGSNEIGSELYHRGARRQIKVQCEMGGKNPLVVLEDADLELAVESTAQGAFGSTGQRCTATSRAVVVESIANRFVDALLQRIRKIRVGNGLDKSVEMGPSVDKSQMETVLRYIDIGKEEGAQLRCGGHRLEDPPYDRGYFVAPTLFDYVQPSMRIAQEEIFGPVLSVIRVRDFDEALAVANGVKYGLSSSLYTNDASKIFKFIERIETGVTHVNSPTTGGEAHLPFGGVKATGVGLREMGRTAMEFYTELKTVYIDYTGQKRTTFLY